MQTNLKSLIYFLVIQGMLMLMLMLVLVLMHVDLCDAAGKGQRSHRRKPVQPQGQYQQAKGLTCNPYHVHGLPQRPPLSVVVTGNSVPIITNVGITAGSQYSMSMCLASALWSSLSQTDTDIKDKQLSSHFSLPLLVSESKASAARAQINRDAPTENEIDDELASIFDIDLLALRATSWPHYLAYMRHIIHMPKSVGDMQMTGSVMTSQDHVSIVYHSTQSVSHARGMTRRDVAVKMFRPLSERYSDGGPKTMDQFMEYHILACLGYCAYIRTPIALIPHTAPAGTASSYESSSPTIVYPWMVYTMRDRLRSDSFMVRFDENQGPHVMRAMRMTPPALAQLESWLGPIFKGFAFLKDSDVLHRNIKPETFLMTQDHLLKIGGFRYATNLRTRSIYERKRLSSQVYNVNYRAPEVLAGRGDYSYPADIWAIGITLLEAVLGMHPYLMFGMLYPPGTPSYPLYMYGPHLEAHIIETVLHFKGPWNPTLLPVLLQMAQQRVAKVEILQLIYYCLLYDPAERITPKNALKLLRIPEQSSHDESDSDLRLHLYQSSDLDSDLDLDSGPGPGSDM